MALKTLTIVATLVQLHAIDEEEYRKPNHTLRVVVQQTKNAKN